ncbi:hypothetical protein [Streptomyces sp. NPDC051665]|uniref:hypothetical protein n=1 Tax=Streptomyces sp. NPDC051665 TaxID=3154647 RepID=UPI003420362B
MRYKTRTMQRPTTVERGGRTHDVFEKVTVREPVIRDADVIVGRLVTAATMLIVAIALTWSIVSIGDLLSGSAPTWAAYLTAGAFDLAWAVAMALEWLLRYDRRAVIPRVVGWLMLAVSMTAISTHGALHAGIWVGIIGAFVSMLAKALWAVMMMVTARPLSDIDRQVVEQRRSEISGELALATVERELIRTRKTTAAIEAGGSLIEAEWEASGLTRAQLAEAVVSEVSREPEPVMSPEPEPIREPIPAQAHEPDRSSLEGIRERLAQRARLGEPELIPAQAHEPVSPDHDSDHGSDPAQAQIDELSRRLNAGERLTKSSAAQILGVSEATAGRRLREARSGGGYL